MNVVAAELTGVEKEIQILMLKRDVDEILEPRYVARLLLYRFGLLPFILSNSCTVSRKEDCLYMQPIYEL